MSNPYIAQTNGLKYCDLTMTQGVDEYDKASRWEKSNTHECCRDESLVIIQVRMKLETYFDDYQDCDHCYVLPEQLFIDHPQFAGTQQVTNDDGNVTEQNIYQPTTWGD